MSKKYTDWGGYWIGLRQNLIKCIGTTGTAWLGTNVAAVSGVPIPAIDWKQAAAMFGVHIAIEVFTYLKNVEPKIVTVEETSMTNTKPDGSAVQQTTNVTTIITPPTNE